MPEVTELTGCVDLQSETVSPCFLRLEYKRLISLIKYIEYMYIYAL